VIPAQQLARIIPMLDAGQLTRKQQDDLFGALKQELNARCAADGLFWAKFVSTRDEADPEHSIKLFPLHEEYVRQLWADWTEYQVSVVAKSCKM